MSKQRGVISDEYSYLHSETETMSKHVKAINTFTKELKTFIDYDKINGSDPREESRMFQNLWAPGMRWIPDC